MKTMILGSTSGNVEFHANNAEAMRIDSSGKVHIGATTGTGILNVDGGAGEGSIYVEGTHSGSAITARLLASDGGAVFFGSSSNHDLRIQTNGTNRMFITTSGTMGFGMSPLGTNNGSAFFDGNVSSKDGFMTTASDLQMIAPAAGNTIFVRDNGNESMRINSSGQVGIACTDQSNLLTVDANSASSGTDSISVRNRGVSSVNHTTGLRFQFSAAVPSAIRSRLTNTGNGAGTLSFYTSANGSAVNLTERMTIDSAGNIGIGTTSPDGPLHIDAATSNPIFTVHKNSTGVSDAVRIRHGRGLSGFNGKGINFLRNDGTSVGAVVIGFTSTTYQTSSDYRLKENVNYTWDATTKLKQLKPARFNFIEEPTIEVDGFLAHEVQDIVPQAVSGEKDAVDADGNPDYQGIDHSKLVPLLVKTIQELETRITALES